MLSILSALFNFFTMVLGLDKAHSFPPPLSGKEEQALFEKMNKERDKDARSRLIEHNLRLVSHIVRKYYASYAYPDELVSIGSYGLIKAVDSYSCSNGARFATYAGKCIQNEILMFFRAQKKTSGEVSMNETIDIDKDGNPLTYMDIIATEDTFAEDLDKKIYISKLTDAINAIPDKREKDIIVLRYGLSGKKPLTQNQIAEMMHISRSYVSRLEKKAMARIKSAFLSFD